MSLENDLKEYIIEKQKYLKKYLDEDAFSVFKPIVITTNNALVSTAFPGEYSNRVILKQLDKFLDHYSSVENGNFIDEIKDSWFEKLERFAYAITLSNIKRSKEALSKGDLIKAIEFINEANYFSAVMSENHFSSEHKSMIMANAAKIKHKPKTEKKKNAVKDYKQNRDSFENKDDAAEKLSSKYELGFSTIRKALRNV